MQRMVIGNWKSNLTLADAETLATMVAVEADKHTAVTIAIAPSLPWIVPIRQNLKFMPKNFKLASQVVSQFGTGAYTGDVAASQLKGIVDYALVGHSERRKYHNESGEHSSARVVQLLDNDITPVVCFGEMEQSEDGAIDQVLQDLEADLKGLSHEAVSKLVLAYEPVWAIGSGNPATPEYAEGVVKAVKQWVNDVYEVEVPVLYGGSVTDANAGDFGDIKAIDGLLVGGASLKAQTFLTICERFVHGVA